MSRHDQLWINIWISLLLSGGLAYILIHIKSNHDVEWPLVTLIAAIFITALALKFPKLTFDLLKSLKFWGKNNAGGLE